MTELNLTREEMIKKLRDYGYERDYGVSLDSMDTEDLECELITREMEEEFYVEARGELITTKVQILEVLDETIACVESAEPVCRKMVQFRDTIKDAVIPDPLPDLWGYTMEFTESCYKLILGRFDVACTPSVDGNDFDELAMGFLGDYVLISFRTQSDGMDSEEIPFFRILALHGGETMESPFLKRFFRG